MARAYGTYGILIAVVLVGQIGNFAGLSNLEPPLNVTALFRCGQIGNRLCPDPWIGAPAASDPQGFRFPVWEFNWPGAYRMDNGRPVAIVQRQPPVVGSVSPYPLTYRLDFLATAGTLVLIAAVFAFVPMRLAGVPMAALGRMFAPDDQAAAAANRHDRVYPLDLDHHELFGDDLVNGAGARQDRASCSRSSPRGWV